MLVLCHVEAVVGFTCCNVIVVKTHSAFSLSLVALDFGLKLIDELLHPQQSLPVLLRLQEDEENQ